MATAGDIRNCVKTLGDPGYASVGTIKCIKSDYYLMDIFQYHLRLGTKEIFYVFVNVN